MNEMKRLEMITKHLLLINDNSIIKTNNLSSESDDNILVNNYNNNAIIRITLNRKKALNSLNLEMVNTIDDIINTKNDNTRLFIIDSNSERAFCAGGDIRMLANASKEKHFEYPSTFFGNEYKLDNKIANLAHTNTKWISFINGICMGGGVGLSIHSSIRIVSENLKFAMPETGIGLFPDVGGSYFLSRLPYNIGMFLGLTGYRVNTADALFCGIATHFCPFDKFEQLKGDIINLNAITIDEIDTLLSSYNTDELVNQYLGNKKNSKLEEQKDWINDCFQGDTLEEIFDRLRGYKEIEWADNILKILKTKSPSSMKVTFECIRRGKSLSISEVLEMEFKVAMRCMRNHDFYEGVRSVIIDKDNTPNWNPKTIYDITQEDIDQYFNDDPEFSLNIIDS
eukprot:TRINITY_DN795_c3_g1_i1.p1 TRINITY_DN795_c3_g1~~TRINITY_DN795_c3_g1_i1.p1  ORF type:complete len:397 (+),score=93.99 TRINITY_DN795_c3_g1_i1:162-1352(+)